MLTSVAIDDIRADVKTNLNQYLFMAFGSGATAAASSDTALQTEWVAAKYRDGATRENLVTWSWGDNEGDVSIDIDWVGAYGEVLSEVGIFDSDVIGAGNMLTRVVLHTAYTISATLKITINSAMKVTVEDTKPGG